MVTLLISKLKYLFYLMCLIVIVNPSSFAGNLSLNETNVGESQHEIEADKLMNAYTNIMHEFLTLIKQGNIPGIQPDDKGWRSGVFKLTPEYIEHSKEFDWHQFQQEVGECSNLYKVDAEKTIGNLKKRVRCFFCIKADNIQLLSVYSSVNSNDKWHREF
jgi:hypothetical protein